MNQRLVWNFEYAPKTSMAPKELFQEQVTEQLKWEIRFFWPDSEPIILYPIDNSLLNLSNYRQKHRKDYYYLVPENNYNIKRRRNQLLYKPLLKQSGQAMAFGGKINMDLLEGSSDTTNSTLHESIDQISKKGVVIYVEKEAFVYKFPTTPTIKLELARLIVNNKVYLSACIEGKSLKLVKNIAENLLDKQVSCDYVTFLKNIMPL